MASPQHERILAEIRELVQNDLLEDALERIVDIGVDRNSVSQLIRRFKRIRKQEYSGTLTREQAGVEYASITEVILQILSAPHDWRQPASTFRDVSETPLSKAVHPSSPSSTRKLSLRGTQHSRRQISPSITWLHLSDLHFRELHSYDEDIVLTALLEDITERIERDGLQPSFIVVTGDIAFSGKSSEYDLAKEFFDKLLTTTNLPKGLLFIVPGNHDVDRDQITITTHAAGKRLNDPSSVNEVLRTPEDRQRFMERFGGYQRFINDYFEHLRFDDESYFYVRTLEIGDVLISLLGLNSAWLCASDEDRGCLVIGDSQVRKALQQTESADLRIALLHHPFDWLREFDQRASALMLLDRCHFILHGHLHQTGITRLGSPENEAMILASGACYEARDSHNMYNWVRLELGMGTGTVFLRRFSDQRGGFWTQDSLTYKNTPDGRFDFRFAPLDYEPEGEPDESHTGVYHEPGLSQAEPTFILTFANREDEKKTILDLLAEDSYVQIHAPRGLGKTYVLREIKRELEEKGWCAVWIDFSSTPHQPSSEDRFQFMQEVYWQLSRDASTDIVDFEEHRAIERIGRQLVDLEKMILLIDNADISTRPLWQWLRGTFFPRLSEYLSGIQVLASGQHVIAEWNGHNYPGRPFREMALSGFENPLIVQTLIDDAVTQLGPWQIQNMREERPGEWQDHLQKLSKGLIRITRGHPLAIQRVLRYAIDRDGLTHATFFADEHIELCRRFLAPIGERILRTLDRNVREAFRSLCIFRYVWQTLIQELTDTTIPADLGGPWEPFSTGTRPWEHWWRALLDSHLIHEAETRNMFPLSPVVRQVIAQVMQAEDAGFYHIRNYFARLQYQKLLRSAELSIRGCAAYILEIMYHYTQDHSLEPSAASSTFIGILTDFLTDLPAPESHEAAKLVGSWLHEDTELKDSISQFSDPKLYDQLVETAEGFV